MTQHVNFGQVPPETLGWRIQRALNYAGIKQDTLAAKFEVSRKTVSRWCNDGGPPPKKFILEQIALMCGVSARWLIDGIAEGPHPPGGAGMVSANIAIPPRARLIVVDEQGNEDAAAMQQLAPVTELPRPLILRLTAECAANCATGDYDVVTLPYLAAVA